MRRGWWSEKRAWSKEEYIVSIRCGCEEQTKSMMDPEEGRVTKCGIWMGLSTVRECRERILDIAFP
jgi:hypothetical protein